MKLVKSILISLLLISCSHHGHDEEKLPKESNVQITKDLKGHRWGNIYFSAQPSGKTMRQLKEAGFKTIINLREKKEKLYIEAWEAKKFKMLGLNYYNIPFSMKDEMSDEYISSVTSKVMKHRSEGKTLIHCSSGNRVGIWLGAHFKKDHKFSNKLSLSLAKELGLTNPEAEKKLKAYLKK